MKQIIRIVFNHFQNIYWQLNKKPSNIIEGLLVFILERHGCLFTEACIFLFVSSAFNMAVYQFSQFIEADFITEALYVCPVPEIYFIIVRAVLSFSARTIFIRFSILRYISLQFFILQSIVIICILCGYNRQKCD